MKILNRAQIQNWDSYTIDNEPISSIDLMERASRKCAEWIISRYSSNIPVHIFCGIGNNGGDGLAIARILINNDYAVESYVCKFSEYSSKDHQVNHQRLEAMYYEINTIEGALDIPELQSDVLVIDAIFGSGLTRPIEGWLAELVDAINEANPTIVSIDMPSGLYCEENQTNPLSTVIKADHTLTFQIPKLSQLLPLTGKYCGELHLFDINLHDAYLDNVDTDYFYIDQDQLLKFQIF